MSCKVIKIGDSTAIICGRKDHACNDDGPIIYELKDGTRLTRDDPEFDNKMPFIISGSVSCSICGRLEIENAPYLNI
jgi:hypothetical protein